MTQIRSVCVFCGASNKIAQHYLDEGKEIGHMLADNNIRMVFGAGDCGLMGATANGALENNGYVLGVYPDTLNGIEAEHMHLSEIIHVSNMHIRKMVMFEKSDAFLILPGGFGTMDETFEIITWKQLHTHDKPIIIYNYRGYWDEWVKLANQFIDEKFADESVRDLFIVANQREDILAYLDKVNKEDN